MIDGVEVHPQRRISDERGVIMRMLRRVDPWSRNSERYISRSFIQA
jgi:dTDP-4-dehydrorhamnose 3,5-epimerase-like enzyme